jgi:hypothetical protein
LLLLVAVAVDGTNQAVAARVDLEHPQGLAAAGVLPNRFYLLFPELAIP